ncbi:FxsA family protein [Kineosporia sp. NBRC 101731]|uniref:FxsA family protein n=1 Tax=Kineosporia sp. NBRC 101731 TaxID=3032199 RepID=UPI0024A09EC3|nr:FxsA family protein [Kineosporia sp. NBRC 101731]GLY31862.1 hypothetical protein Kisp02_52270 [Kineosporia sp. NBRC 101731]
MLPLLELIIAIEIGTVIGGLAVWGLFLLGSVVGATIVRRQGVAAWRALTSSIRSGTPPSRDLADATILILAGMLFTFPGFATDVAALLLVLPFTRPLARRPLERYFRRAAADQASMRSAYVNRVQFGPGVPGSGAAGAAGPAGAPGAGRFGAGFGRDDVIQGEVVDEGNERP